MEVGSIVDGGVSTAVQLKYSGNQPRVRPSDLLQEGENTVDNVGCRARSSVDMSSHLNTTNKGDLLSNKGELGMLSRTSPRGCISKSTENAKARAPAYPGERIEADVIIGERVIALRPANESMMKGAVR